MKHYIRVWKQLAINSFGNATSTKVDSFGYLAGKIVRLVGFFILISALFKGITNFGGYTKHEALLFFLTFYLLDTATQVIFRGVYAFRTSVKRGNFDFFLTKPMSALFLVMSQVIDFLDILFLIPITGLWVWSILQLDTITTAGLLAYAFFSAISVLLITAIYILVAATTILVQDNQHAIWLYRESMRLGQFPPTILPRAMQYVFTYIFPILIVVAFPTRALFGELGFIDAILAMWITIIFLLLSFFLWKMSVKKYSSASS